MIMFKQLSKYYPTKQGRRYIFKDVNLSLPMDKSIGVLGPNGAGKSTLIKILGGADYPSKGKVTSPLKVSWPLGLRGGLQGSMSGRENVRFVARIHGFTDTKMVEEKVSDFAEIGIYFDEPVKTYSSGMRARVAFGLTMAFDFDFDVLLVDELTAVGDTNFKKKSEKVLKNKYENTKVIMVNHSANELKKYCQAGLLIKDQNLHYFDELDHALQEYQSCYVTH
ncbi:ABC transporter ATP-binding protein [Paraglaciecola arctica]|uniref:ABC transporter ATP-binding protein n=1 Tax=Paraglaciecola arctica TaxID=1128911 RepID=UPI001C07755B|nr:ABC transporter ATP-binding protein [Paraglaciecola arctica]MBU3003365.1 ABC transporter ATP-binding protein [Paraglaciecola arctica]